MQSRLLKFCKLSMDNSPSEVYTRLVLPTRWIVPEDAETLSETEGKLAHMAVQTEALGLTRA